MQSARWRWTWCQKRLGRWHYSHPDYILARGGETLYFRKVAFRTPLVHHSDHRAVVPAFRARKTKRLTKYPHHRQRLPLRLPSKPHDELTQTFEALKLTCKKSRKPKNGKGTNGSPRKRGISSATDRCFAGLVNFARLRRVRSTAGMGRATRGPQSLDSPSWRLD
jgi:hypothetical protein